MGVISKGGSKRGYQSWGRSESLSRLTGKSWVLTGLKSMASRRPSSKPLGLGFPRVSSGAVIPGRARDRVLVMTAPGFETASSVARACEHSISDYRKITKLNSIPNLLMIRHEELKMN